MALRHDSEHRTFNVVLASLYELWQLSTFVSWADEALLMDVRASEDINLLLTLRPDTLDLPELCWLFTNFFQFGAGAACLRLTNAQSRLPAEPPRKDLLSAFAEQVHNYLDLFDVPAIVKYLVREVDRAHLDVVLRRVPCPEHDPDGFERHLRICMDCIRLTYIDDSFKRLVALHPSATTTKNTKRTTQ